MCGGEGGKERANGSILGGFSLTLTAFLDRTVAATASLHIASERGRPPCGAAHRAGEVGGDLGSARAPPKRVDFGREQVPRQNRRDDLCSYAGPCPIRLVIDLGRVGERRCGSYRARTCVHLRKRVELAALSRARAPRRPARHATQNPSTDDVLRPPSATGDGYSSFTRAGGDAAGLVVERDRIRTHFERASGDG